MDPIRRKNLGSADPRDVLPALDPAEFEVSSSSSESSQDIAIEEVISNVVNRRRQGEHIVIDDVIALHPQLMPRLRQELLEVDAIYRAVNQPDAIQSAAPNDVLSRDQNDEGNDPASAAEKTVEEPVPQLIGYCIQEKIRSGGQATVYRAVQISTGRIVAVKVLHGGPCVESRKRTRFERESAILASLDHPNVVSILERGRTPDGSHFIVMDFIDGCDLDTFVERLGKDARAIVRVFIKIARALQETHQNGVVHRDLKPMNIRVDRRSEPYLLDFGMARLSASENRSQSQTVTREGSVLGSLRWTSPEQVAAHAVDARCDIYALGVMLYISLSGELPYPASDDSLAVAKHIANTAPLPLVRRARRNGIRINRYLEQIIFKALAKLPSHRYQTAGSFASDLEIWLTRKRPPRGPVLRVCEYVVALVVIAILGAVALDGRKGFYYSNIVLNRITLGHAGNPVNYELPDRATEILGTLGIHLAKIPKGSVTVSRDNNGPAHSPMVLTTDHDFFITVTDITLGQYLAMIGHPISGQKHVSTDSPIQNITWSDANEFCRLLGQHIHEKCRLPTQREWEFTFCRGQPVSRTLIGVSQMAWYIENSGRSLHPVAKKRADGWGLFDMLGNVRQWCDDLAIASSDAGNIPESAFHVVEGTDYLATAQDCLLPLPPTVSYPSNTKSPTIGFRVVVDLNGGN